MQLKCKDGVKGYKELLKLNLIIGYMPQFLFDKSISKLVS